MQIVESFLDLGRRLVTPTRIGLEAPEHDSVKRERHSRRHL
jgi:hypothetical protein